VNKAPIAAKTNRMIGGDSPSVYLERLQRREKLTPQRLDQILSTHVVDPVALRADDFDAFFTARQAALLSRIAKAMGKVISGEVASVSDQTAGTGPDEIEAEVDEDTTEDGVVPGFGPNGSDGNGQAPQDLSQFVRAVLQRRGVPQGQKDLYKALAKAGDQGVPRDELPVRLGWTPYELSGVLGALGKRIHGTEGSEAVAKALGLGPDITLFIDIRNLGGRSYWRLREEVRQVLSEEGLI